MPLWVDCHTHIDGLSDAEQHEVVDRALSAGVRWMINASDDQASWHRVLKLVERFSDIYGNLGVHPHHAKDVTEQTYEALKSALGHSKIVAVGEIGLDFYYENSPRVTQIEVFDRQMDLAMKIKMPVIVHHRESSNEIVNCMQKFCARGLRGMIHCFSGSWAFAKELLDMGLYVSFSGILTFRNALDIRDVAMKIPLDRVLLETDSPYLAPAPVRGTTNEPKNLVFTAQYLAEMRKLPLSDLSDQILRNSRTLFGVP